MPLSTDWKIKGPLLWADLHMAALDHRITPQYLKAFRLAIDDEEGSKSWDYALNLFSYVFSTITLQTDQFHWSVCMHNLFNRMENKPYMKLEDARDLWKIPPLRTPPPTVFVVVNIRNGPLDLLPHWLEHYKALGVDRMLVNVYMGSVPYKLHRDIFRMLDPENIFCWWTENEEQWTDTLQDDVAREFTEQYAKPTDWIIYADLDEFHEFPAPLPTIIESCERNGIEWVPGNLIDRVAADGSFPAAKESPSLFEQYPIQCNITGGVLGGWTAKMMMSRASVIPTTGHHSATKGALCGIPWGSGEMYRVNHFKWREGVLERNRWTLDNAASKAEGWKAENKRLNEWLSANGGKINLADERLGIK